MSGHSYGDECPKCGSNMDCYMETRGAFVSGECLECGYYYCTEDKQMPLEEVNDLREERDLEPLTELKKQRG